MALKRMSPFINTPQRETKIPKPVDVASKVIEKPMTETKLQEVVSKAAESIKYESLPSLTPVEYFTGCMGVKDNEEIKTFDYRLVEAKPTTLVVHCSSPRFQRAFQTFIKEDLKLDDGNYVPVVIGGGAAALLRPLNLPKEFKFLKDRILLHKDDYPTINRIILINHEDCAYYRNMKLPNWVYKVGSELADLVNVPMVLKVLLKTLGIDLELYYASIDNGEVKFKKL